MRRTSKVPSASSLGASREHEDAIQSLRQENAALKKERNELTEKLQRVQVQFQRLVADVRPAPREAHTTSRAASTTGASDVLPALQRSGSLSSGTVHPALTSPSSRELVSTRQSLAQARAEIQDLRQSLMAVQQQLRLQRTTGALMTPASPSSAQTGLAEAEQQRHRSEVAALRQQLLMAERRLNELADDALAQQRRDAFSTASASRDVMPTSSATAAALSPPTRAEGPTEATNAALVKGAQNEVEAKYKAVIEQLVQEKQALAVQVKLLEQDKAFDAEEQVSLDPNTVMQLQGEVRQKAHQLTLLQSRLDTSQGQMDMLKGECTRLVEELKSCHALAGEQKKITFQLEHDKSNLERRIGQLQEVELALQRKSEEVINLEHELLKSVGALQSCNRETEQAVRAEFLSKVRELQEMRDQADASRRRAEKELLEVRQALETTKRRCSSLEEDTLLYRTELAKSEKQNQTLAAQSTLFAHSAKELTEADVHRAIAVAAIQRRAAAEKDMGLVPDKEGASTDDDGVGGGRDVGASNVDQAGGEANKALDLYEALHWDDTWEQGRLREALSAAALDMELAESRCQQMRDQAESVRAQLTDMTQERDTLLEENVEMRRRLTHVQTVFAKQQLQAYRHAAAAHRDGPQAGLIHFCIRDLQCEDAAMTAALHVNTLQDPTTIFFSLDGLETYETMLSPALYALTEPIDVHFEYTDLDKDEVTIGLIQRTTFTFQLHRVAEDGTGSVLVAMAELPGTVLLSARESSTEEVLRLMDGSGRTLGQVTVECACSQLLLPVLLQAPLTADGSGGLPFLSASQVKSAIVALRAVRFLRVQIFTARGLLADSDALPHRFYVFYTGHSPTGALNCVRDTVVRPANGASSSATADQELVFNDDAVDHRVVADRDLVAFIAHGSLVFVLFDECTPDVQTNAGTVEVPLRPLLASPQAFIHKTEPLHPRGELTIGVSWISGP